MQLFLRQFKLLALISATALIGACTSSVMPPVEQIHQAQKTKEPVKTVTKQVEGASEVTIYSCDNEQKVEIERQKKAEKSAKKETVTVTFQDSSHQLSLAVSKNGKKYTNIRWTWLETREGKAFLYNNTKKTLAANCVKQG